MYKILGPRILLKVRKFNNKDTKYEGSSLYMPEEFLDKETQFQTDGEVVQIGPAVTQSYAGFDDLKPGDTVHFARYGAVRLTVKNADNFEYWVINGKDALLIETKDAEVVNE